MVLTGFSRGGGGVALLNRGWVLAAVAVVWYRWVLAAAVAVLLTQIEAFYNLVVKSQRQRVLAALQQLWRC
jgi:hypothetical protein